MSQYKKSQKQFTPDFIIIPYKVMIDTRLQPTDKMLYGVLYWMERLKDGKCTASNGTLAKISGVTEGTVANALGRLSEVGYIKRKFEDETEAHRLSISCVIGFRVGSSNDEGGSLNNEATGSSNNEQISNIYNKYIAEGLKDHSAFSLEEAIKKMEDDKRRHLNVIALYWRVKKPKLTSKAQAYDQIKRLVRPATRLAKYEDDRLVETMEWLSKKADFKWTLETVEKYITEDIKKFKKP